MSEIWKDIKNYEGYYQISNLGNVKSLPRIIKKSDNTVYTAKEKILRPATDVCGYHRCALSKDRKLSTFKVHRLVALAFCEGKTQEKNQVNHKDGNKKNNKASNLEWSTSSENCQHSFDIGLQKPKRGILNGNSRLTESDVMHIRDERGKYGITYQKIADGYRLNKKTVMQICKFEIWSHVR